MKDSIRDCGYYLVQINSGYDIAYWSKSSWDICGSSDEKSDDYFYFISKEKILGLADHLEGIHGKKKSELHINVKINLLNE